MRELWKFTVSRFAKSSDQGKIPPAHYSLFALSLFPCHILLTLIAVVTSLALLWPLPSSMGLKRHQPQLLDILFSHPLVPIIVFVLFFLLLSFPLPFHSTYLQVLPFPQLFCAPYPAHAALSPITPTRTLLGISFDKFPCSLSPWPQQNPIQFLHWL